MRHIKVFLGTVGSGKSYNADKMSKEFGYKKISFADSLRDIAFTSLGINPDSINYRKFKEEIIYGNVSFRNYLQLLGDGIRKYDPDYFPKAILKIIDESNDDICIDDLRFGNEFIMIKEYCDSNRINLTSFFCNYPSPFRNDNSTHISERMAQYFLAKGYSHLQMVDNNDIVKYYYNIENASKLKDDVNKIMSMLNERIK